MGDQRTEILGQISPNYGAITGLASRQSHVGIKARHRAGLAHCPRVELDSQIVPDDTFSGVSRNPRALSQSGVTQNSRGLSQSAVNEQIILRENVEIPMEYFEECMVCF